MSGLDYTKQKLFEATRALVGSRNLNERLTFAASYLLHLQDKDIPKKYQERIVAIKKKLTVTPLSTETGYAPRQLSELEATEISGEILGLLVEALGGL